MLYKIVLFFSNALFAQKCCSQPKMSHKSIQDKIQVHLIIQIKIFFIRACLIISSFQSYHAICSLAGRAKSSQTKPPAWKTSRLVFVSQLFLLAHHQRTAKLKMGLSVKYVYLKSWLKLADMELHLLWVMASLCAYCRCLIRVTVKY